MKGLKDLFEPFVLFVGACSAMLFFLIFGPVLQGMWEERTPATRWMEYQGFHINDARVGDVPVIEAKRIIRQQFYATTRATLRKVVSQEGGSEKTQYLDICGRSSAWHFMPNTILPEQTTLDVFLEVPPNLMCLPDTPGFYILTIWVTISVEGSARQKTLQVTSNVFQVTE